MGPDDPLRHPDLVEVAHRLRRHLELVLDAERAAAALAARRTVTIRDRLIEAEDAGRRVLLVCCDGGQRVGRVCGVGLDVVILAGPGREQSVALQHVVAIEEVT
jgi:hypothetical protein